MIWRWFISGLLCGVTINMNDTTQRAWLITGCSSGLGRALAEKVLAKGDLVAATARSLETLADLAERYPETCLPFALDVTEAGQVEAVVRGVVARTHRLDVVVNNAGYGLLGALEESTDEQIQRNFATIVFGAIYVLRAALPTLRAQRHGRIINISAAAAIANYAGFSIYGGAKYALEGISEGLAAEVKPLGIKVTLVQPGPFRTEFISRSLETTPGAVEDYQGTVGKFAAFLRKMDGRQPGDPARAAEAIIQISEMENPPLRVALGKYATEKAERVLQARQRELAAVKELELAGDYP
jgi:NAD(P)-dependent dehydrogenase (short-subunit alcohol dehydrogenase family)